MSSLARPHRATPRVTGALHMLSRRPEVLLAAALAVAIAYILAKGGALTWWSDDWAFIMRRHGLTADTFLAPHNGHLAVFHVLAYKAVFELWGLSTYLPLRVMLLALHATVVLLLFVYARRRTSPWAALAIAAPMVFLGAATEVMIYPFHIGNVGALAAGLGALLMLDRPSPRRDVLAAALLVVSAGSSSMGLPFLAAAALEVAGSPERRSRWWVAALPIVLWGLWRLGYPSGTPGLGHPTAIPAYVLQGLGRSAGAPFGVGADWGNTLVVGLLVLAIREVGRRAGLLRLRLWSTLAMVVLFWSSVAIARGDLGHEATERFLYPGALFMLLVLAECAGQFRISRAVWPLAVVAAGALALQNLALFRGQLDLLRFQSDTVAGGLVGAELAGDRAQPDMELPIPVYSMTARQYADVRSFLGSPVDGTREIARRGDVAAASADRVLVETRAVDAVATSPTDRLAGPPPDGTPAAASTRTRRSCLAVTPEGEGGGVELELPAAGLQVRAGGGDVQLSLRKFASGFGSAPQRSVPADEARVLRIPADADPTPWRVQLHASAPFEVCRSA